MQRPEPVPASSVTMQSTRAAYVLPENRGIGDPARTFAPEMAFDRIQHLLAVMTHHVHRRSAHVRSDDHVRQLEKTIARLQRLDLEYVERGPAETAALQHVVERVLV